MFGAKYHSPAHDKASAKKGDKKGNIIINQVFKNCSVYVAQAQCANHLGCPVESNKVVMPQINTTGLNPDRCRSLMYLNLLKSASQKKNSKFDYDSKE